MVLVEVGGVARSGHEYDDRTGVSYEYPAGRYERLIQPGVRFVYQVPGSGYVGCGIIGQVNDASTPGRLQCEVLAVRMFAEPVPLKSSSGSYHEADTAYWRGKVYWGQGVRPLSDLRYAEIVALSDVAYEIVPAPTASGYASPVDADRVERYSVGIAAEVMSRRFNESVTAMHHNNPGFDLLVGSLDAPVRFVEVKGTRSLEPVFLMSEGERSFSVRNAPLYTLVVVTGVDLQSDSHVDVVVHDGEVAGSMFSLRPTQWRGRVLGPSVVHRDSRAERTARPASASRA